MNKIAIITINDDNNYGNRLQNYAVQITLNKFNFEATTLKIKKNTIDIKRIIKIIINYKNQQKFEKRVFSFKKFNKCYIKELNMPDINNILNDRYDYFIVGSDQVWNPNFNRLSNIDLLSFAEPNKRISVSASFGINELPEQYHKKLKKNLSQFKAISVREEAGKKIIEDVVGRTDVEVLIDPTMLLSAAEWDKVSKKPTMLKENRYILNYFLGTLSESRKNEINRVAKENDCEVINILDPNAPFYECGPSEFLYLEKHAFLICTDSFHSSVFAIIYNRPFLVFEREDSLKSMNSRIETLLSKFELEDRKFKNKITKKDLKHDYKNAYKILEQERKKAIDWLENALNE